MTCMSRGRLDSVGIVLERAMGDVMYVMIIIDVGKWTRIKSSYTYTRYTMVSGHLSHFL